jgi:ATP-dependent Zn protease
MEQFRLTWGRGVDSIIYIRGERMEEFKAKHQGTKGFLELGEKELTFMPKHEADGRVTIKYEDMTAINRKNIFEIFFTIILIPFYILYIIFCIFARSMSSGGGSNKVKVSTKSNGSYTFYILGRGRGDLIRQLKAQIK